LLKYFIKEFLKETKTTAIPTIIIAAIPIGGIRSVTLVTLINLLYLISDFSKMISLKENAKIKFTITKRIILMIIHDNDNIYYLFFDWLIISFGSSFSSLMCKNTIPNKDNSPHNAVFHSKEYLIFNTKCITAIMTASIKL
jgi:hypothetical protein